MYVALNRRTSPHICHLQPPRPSKCRFLFEKLRTGRFRRHSRFRVPLSTVQVLGIKRWGGSGRPSHRLGPAPSRLFTTSCSMWVSRGKPVTHPGSSSEHLLPSPCTHLDPPFVKPPFASGCIEDESMLNNQREGSTHIIRIRLLLFGLGQPHLTKPSMHGPCVKDSPCLSPLSIANASSEKTLNRILT